MAWFQKKARTEKSPCCGYSGCDANSMAEAKKAKADGARVKVLGSGCAKCSQLEAAARAAMQQLGWGDEIDHVRDFAQIAAHGVMTTPALVVDGKVVSHGKVLKTDEIVEILQETRA